MKKKGYVRKLIAIICAIALIVNGNNLALLASANEAAEFTVVGVEALTGADEVTYTTEVKAGNNAGMEGIMIDGLYNFTGDACVYVGTVGWYGLRIQPSGDGLKYWIAPSGSTHDTTVTPVQAGRTLIGKDVRIKVGIKTESTNPDGTANMKYKVCIGNYEKTFVVENVNLTNFAYLRRLHVVPGSGSLTLKKAPEDFEYTVKGVETLTGETEVTYTSEVKPGNNQSAEGILFDGVYNFTGKAGVYVSTAGWYGIKFQLDGDNLKYWIAPSTSIFDKSVTPAEAGVTAFAGKDIRIKAGARTVQTNSDGTIDVEYQVVVGEYATSFVVAGLHATNYALGQRLHVVPDSGTLIVKAAPSEEEPTPPEAEEIPDYDYTVIGAETLTGQDEATYTTEVKAGNNSSVDGFMIDGVYNFVGNACVYVGTVDWYGLRLQLDGDGFKYWIAPGGSTYDKTITAAEAGVTAFKENDIRIKVGIHKVSTNADSTVNLAYKVCIGEYETAFIIKNINAAQWYLLQRLHVVPGNGSLTVKKVPPAPEFAYTEIGVETLTGQDQVTYTTEVKAGNNSAYEEILVDGIYNFTGNATVYFGTAAWNGLRMQLDGTGFKYWIAPSGSEHDTTITPEQAGVTKFAEEDIRIKVGIRTVKTNQDGTANMEYKVCIGEYTKIFELKNVNKTDFVYAQRLHVYPGTGSVTIKKVPAPVEPEFEYEEMDVKVLTGSDSVTYTAEIKPGNNGSWDGKMVDGIYNLTSNACVYFGTADWYGLRVQLDGTGLKYWIAPAGSAHDATIAPAQAGMTEFAGKDIRIKVGIHTASTNQDGTVNLGYKICIGDYETKFTLANVNKTQFQVSQRLHVVPGSGTVVVKTAVPPQEPEDEVDPNYEYNVIDAATLTGEQSVTYTAEAKPGNNNVIEGDMIDGIFNMTGNGGVYFGTVGWYGLKIQPDGTGLKYWVAPDGSAHDKTVTPAQAGCELVGKDVRIKVGIRTVRTNQDGTANMEYKVCIGEYTDAFILKNVNKTTFLYAQRMHVVPGTGSVTVKTAVAEEPEKPLPTDITYASTLGMKDFTGKDEVTYTSDIKPSAGDKSLDGVLIDGIYNFTGNACIYVGAANWTGMRLELSGTDSLRYRFLPGDVGDKVVTPAEAGCELAGKDVRIKLGFTFEEGTITDTKADVIVQVFIGDYTDTFRIKNVDKSSFVGRMFVYPQTGSVTLKHVKETSNEPQVPEGFVAEYDKTMKFTDFGITADTVVAGGEEKPNGGDTENLHKMMVEGTYRFTGEQAAVYIGTRGWGGLRFGTTKTTGELTYMFMDLNGKNTLHAISLTADDTECQLVDADVRIKAGFTIIKENVTESTVDAVIEVSIGDKYKETFVVEGVQKSNLIRGMHVYAAEGSSVTLKVDESDLDYKQEPSDKKVSYDDELTFFDFGLSRDTTVTNGEVRKTAGEGTLDGVSVEGEVYLTGNTIFGFGGAWRGLQFQRGKKGMIYQYLDVDGKGGIYRKEVTDEEVGCPLYDEVLAIKVGFTFSNVNKKAGTADVTIEVNLGDDYRDVFTVKGVLVANLQRTMLLYAADGNGYEDSKLVLKKPVLEEFKVPAGVKIKYDKTMKFTNFGITEDTTVSNAEIKPNGDDKLSIDKMMVEGTYRFSGPQAAAYIGSRGWGGLRFGTTPNGEFTYQFFDNNGKGAMHIITLLEEDTGCKLIDADVRIKAGFTVIKENKKAKTADVIIEVRIGKQYKEMFLVEGVQISNLIRGMHIYAAEGSSVTLKVDQGDLHYVNTPDDKVLTYKEELTFFDFGITDDFLVQEAQTRKVIPGTLDGVSIEGTYFMSGNATFGFGGDWRGLQFQRGTKGMVYQYLDTDGKGGIYRKEVTEEDTGCALYDADVDIKVGFNFSNVNEKAGTADVTIEVCIGGKYRDVFTVKGVRTANLNRHILLYSADATSGFKGSKLVLRKPYMEPFNFKEFGFTKNWKKELRL